MGGEKSVRLFCIPSRLGSPPRRRGKVTAHLERISYLGITPAQAGKRFWPKPNKNGVEDHPRAGGEK